MSTHARTWLLGISGAALGAMLAVAAPVRTASAQGELPGGGEQGCTCNDGGTGNYECAYDQKSCDAGSEACQLKCT